MAFNKKNNTIFLEGECPTLTFIKTFTTNINDKAYLKYLSSWMSGIFSHKAFDNHVTTIFNEIYRPRKFPTLTAYSKVITSGGP